MPRRSPSVFGGADGFNCFTSASSAASCVLSAVSCASMLLICASMLSICVSAASTVISVPPFESGSWQGIFRRARIYLRRLERAGGADAADHEAGAAVRLAGELLVHRVAVAQADEPAPAVGAVDEGAVHGVDAEGDHVAGLGGAGDGVLQPPLVRGQVWRAVLGDML